MAFLWMMEGNRGEIVFQGNWLGFGLGYYCGVVDLERVRNGRYTKLAVEMCKSLSFPTFQTLSSVKVS